MKIKTLDFFKIPEGIRIPYFGGLLYRIIMQKQRKAIIKLPITKLSLNQEPREEKIIVSLTSFPARINTVGYAIKSLFNQTVKPDRIILWLAETQFQGVELPNLLKELCEKGLEIRFCKDLRSHKKYYFALQEQQSNELVITYDDDLIYPEDSIERLYKTHQKFPDCVVCNRAQLCTEENGGLGKYDTWTVYSSEGVKKPSASLFPSTGGGTLYPYQSVDEEVFNDEVMRITALTADDLWMRFMSAKKGTRVIKTRKAHRTFSTLEGSQTEGLQQENCIGGENDRALDRLSARYPEALAEILGKGQIK